jgi:hypothetical protein
MNQCGILLSQKRSLELLKRLIVVVITALFSYSKEKTFYGIEIVIYKFVDRGLGIGGV